MKRLFLSVITLCMMLLTQSSSLADSQVEGAIHVVQPGESLSKLAKKYYNDSTAWSAIYVATNLKAITDEKFTKFFNPWAIVVGQRLLIPPETEIKNLTSEYWRYFVSVFREKNLPLKCQYPFYGTTEKLLTSDGWEKQESFSSYLEFRKYIERLISNSLITEGISFLDDCINPDLPLATQLNRLHVLHGFFGITRPDTPIGDPENKLWKYNVGYSDSTFQLLDWNNDGYDEIIYHTRVEFGNLNHIVLVFSLNPSSKQWSGTMIWPPLETYPQSEHPVVHFAPNLDSKNRHLLAVEGEFLGADHSRYFLLIWRWDDNPELLLDLSISDWCGQPVDWRFTLEGNIIIPAARATSERCGNRETTEILYGNDIYEVKPEVKEKFDRHLECLLHWSWSPKLALCR